MALRWAAVARQDLLRLYEFLEPVNPAAAARVAQAIVARVRRLPAQPRLGAVLSQYEPREVRRVLVGPYEIRYEIADRDVIVLRLFHGREQR